MKEGQLQFSISSVSCSPHDIMRPYNIAVPHLATEATMQRAIHFRDVLSPVFGREQIGVSLHLGRVTSIAKAAQLLYEAGVPVSSIDAPDVFTATRLIHEIIKSFRTGESRAINHVGWWLHSSPSQEAKDRKIDEGLKYSTGNAYPQIVRVNASDWINSTVGPTLRQRLQDHPNIILALEIFPNEQTPQEYIALLQHLVSTNHKETPVYADIDLGHFAEARVRHRERSEIPHPLQIFDALLSDPTTSQLIAITSLNQYMEGDSETHRDLPNGPINLTEATRKLGKAARNNMLPFGPQVVAEFHPGDYEMMIGESGVLFCKKIKRSFDEGLGSSVLVSRTKVPSTKFLPE